MKRRMVALLLAVAFIPFGTAGDPNEQEPALSPSNDAPVTAVALASKAPMIAFGAQDIGNSFSLNPRPNEPVWFLWDRLGNGDWSQERFGTADHAGCAGPTDPTRACVSHIVDVELSDARVSLLEGVRMVVASVNEDDDRSRIVWVTEEGGTQANSIGYANEIITDIDLTPDGSVLVVATEAAATGPFGGDPTGNVRYYQWGAATPVWTSNTDAPVTTVAVSDDGQRVVAGGSPESGEAAHYRFTATGVRSDQTGTTGAVHDLAISQATDKYWSVAVYEGGDINLYSTDSEGGNNAAVRNFRPTSTPKTAVDIHPSGAIWLAGDSGGNLRLYGNIFKTLDNKQLIQTEGGLGSISAIEISGDGRYAVVAAGKNVYFYGISEAGMGLFWKDTLANNVVDIAVGHDGQLVLAGEGSDVHVYRASRVVTGAGPTGAQSATVGQSIVHDVDYTNDGNRETQVSLQSFAPSGWGVQIAPASFTLEPGQTKRVQVNTTVSGSQSAGAAEVRLRHLVANGPEGETKIQFQIGQARSWTLEPNGTANAGIEPGGSAQFHVILRNLGNADDSAVVEAPVTGAGWTASLSQASFNLPPGGLAEFTLTLTAPGDAQELDTGRVDLVVKGTQTKLPITATVGARFGLEMTATSPAGAILAGNTTQLTLHIKNTGNAPDSYSIRADGAPSGWDVLFPDAQNPFLTFAVEPGATRDVPVTIAVPATATEGNYQVRFQATSLGDSGQSVIRAVLLGVEEPVEEKPPQEDGSALLLPALVVALIGAAVWRRTRP